MQTVSVVIPAYNACATIARTLAALVQQTHPVDEIIVVDDGSRDDTARLVQSVPQVTYLFQENAGPAAARNAGARRATGDIIFFTDSDCVPRHDWIAQILSRFSDVSVGAVCGSYGIVNSDVLLARCIQAEIVFRHRHLMPEYPRAFGSYNVAIRKKVFDAVGGFDVGYRRASGEDNDLSYKLLAAGQRIYFARYALVDHVHQASVFAYLKEQYRHGFWRVKMYVDHPVMARGDDYTFFKDIVEVPVVYASFSTGIAAFFWPSLGMYCVFFAGVIFFLNGIFAGVIIKKAFEAFFYAFVMSARAVARTLGFSTGIFCYLCAYCRKKGK